MLNATPCIQAHLASDIIGSSNSGRINVLQAYAAHGALSGVMSVLNGGKFGHGFASGFVSKAAGEHLLNGGEKGKALGTSTSRTFIVGIIGGTVSAATGGKFANGAIQSAIQWAFNAEGEEKPSGKVSIDKDKLSIQLKSKLANVYCDTKGKCNFDVDLKQVTLTVDADGIISASSPLFKGTFQVGKGLTEAGVKVPGAQLTLSNFSGSSFDWELNLPNEIDILGFKFSWPINERGSIDINPVKKACIDGIGKLFQKHLAKSGGSLRCLN